MPARRAPDEKSVGFLGQTTKDVLQDAMRGMRALQATLLALAAAIFAGVGQLGPMAGWAAGFATAALALAALSIASGVFILYKNAEQNALVLALTMLEHGAFPPKFERVELSEDQGKEILDWFAKANKLRAPAVHAQLASWALGAACYAVALVLRLWA